MNRKPDRNGASRWILAILIVILAVTVLWACGRKADPLSPRVEAPAAIGGLTVERFPEGFRLGWAPPGAGVARIRILRSDVTDASCPGCPKESRLITELIPDDDGVLPVTYTDRSVKEGADYTYRLIACGADGVCGDESAETGIKD
ncbi:MAG: hypothetical protein M0P04_01460 [Syntrophales bacterium]|nr:hypothetical protein [Syntrophales bacterium]MDD4339660.1 hypothetical protein [Syntrophales bacterium]HPB70468.1 hypothetical protein [Syntrophales bacterium]HQN25968.1 hypothetical protein [Syntrophales bacterium]HQP29315.1 hypothetical protein [Syntrophales bacterium]